jgi:hypothetical protein
MSTTNRVFGDPQVDALRARQALGGGGIGPTGPAGAPIRSPLGPVRFIDPSNSSGLANDANSGATSLTPILTTAHLNTLLFFKTITANTTITYMSDDPGAIELDYGTLDLQTFRLDFRGTPQILHTGGTVNAGTIAANRAAPGGGQRQIFHTTDIANWAPFVFTGLGGTAPFPTYLTDGAGNFSWIVSGAGSALASATATTDAIANNLTNIPVGSAYTIRRGSRLNRVSGNVPTSSNGFVAFTDFAFDVEDIGSNGGFTGGGVVSASSYLRCSANGIVIGPGQYSNCAIVAGMTQSSVAGEIDISAGLLFTTSSDQIIVPLVLSFDVYVTGFGLISGKNNYASIFLLPLAGAGVQIQDTTGPSSLFAVNSIALVTSTGTNILLWGNGNAGKGVLISPGSTVTAPDDGTNNPTVTGALGDFGFVDVNGATISVARSWNNAAGAYTESGGVATRATTWANYAASLGAGGFAFNAQCVQTNAAIVGL